MKPRQPRPGKFTLVELAKPFRWTKDAATIIGAVERAKKVLPN